MAFGYGDRHNRCCLRARATHFVESQSALKRDGVLIEAKGWVGFGEILLVIIAGLRFSSKHFAAEGWYC